MFVEDALFATLDPTVRRAVTPDGREFTLTDTVGFVRQLPHQLVEAFRSTLEEVADADVVLHVVDASDPDPEGQLSAVRDVLAEVGAEKVPELVVVNKVDAADPDVVRRLLRSQPGAVAVSARTGQGSTSWSPPSPPAAETTGRGGLVVPYTRGDLVNRAHTDGEVLDEEHTPDGTRLHAHVSPWLAAELARTSAVPATERATAG